MATRQSKGQLMPPPKGRKLFDFEAIKWSGRWMIGHQIVRLDQKHSADMFSTDNMGTAMEWMKMGFRVWDQKEGKQMYFLDQFMLDKDQGGVDE